MKQPVITVEDSEGIEHSLPTKFVVCHRCEGRGSHVNPSIDSHGIGAEEWANDWDDEEREKYFSGFYDVPCQECHGERVIAVPDEDRCPAELLRLYYEDLQSESDYRAEVEAERRMGA